MSVNIGGGGGYLTATIHITRKATGETETHELVMPIAREQAQEIVQQQEEKDDSNPLDLGA